MLVIILLLMAVPASACGFTLDGGLHHHLGYLFALIPFLGTWASMQAYRKKCKRDDKKGSTK